MMLVTGLRAQLDHPGCPHLDILHYHLDTCKDPLSKWARVAGSGCGEVDFSVGDTFQPTTPACRLTPLWQPHAAGAWPEWGTDLNFLWRAIVLPRDPVAGS